MLIVMELSKIMRNILKILFLMKMELVMILNDFYF